MTPAQREALLQLAHAWQQLATCASANTRTMHALGVRVDRVLAGVHIAEAAAALAAELEQLAGDVAPAAEREG